MASYRDLAGALEALCRLVRGGTISPTSVLLARCDALVEEARKGRTAETAWTPFVQTVAPSWADQNKLLRAARSVGLSEEEAKAIWQREIGDAKVFSNSRYQVLVRAPGDGSVIYLSIKRLDQQPIRSWRDLQRIKTEIVGPENEAVELFPAESRLLDAANQFHLWVCADPAMRLPFGFDSGRHVSDNLKELGLGEGQEPLEP